MNDASCLIHIPTKWCVCIMCGLYLFIPFSIICPWMY
uniref:Uncharacterized protein n=1 Tax=Setaria italica TaxID=4555 RepID=K4AND5_SETIT